MVWHFIILNNLNDYMISIWYQIQVTATCLWK